MKESGGIIMTQPATEKKLSERLLPIGVNLISFGIFAAVAIILRASVAPVRILVTFCLSFFVQLCYSLSIEPVRPTKGMTVKHLFTDRLDQ